MDQDTKAQPDPPPKYTKDSGADKTKCCSVKKAAVALAVYAAVLTALMLVLSTLGGLKYQQLVNQVENCDDNDVAPDENFLEEREDTYEDEGQVMLKKTSIDYQRELEILRYFSPGEFIHGSIIVLDYKRSMTGLYIPEAAECYLIGGVDHHIASPFRGLQENSEPVNETTTPMMKGDTADYYDDDSGDDMIPSPSGPADEEVSLYYRKAEDYPVLDVSILPRPLRVYCMDKDIYWLERTQETDMTTRTRVRRGWFKSIWKGIKRAVKWVLRRGVYIKITVTY